MNSNNKPEWFDWLDRNVPVNYKGAKFKEGTPEEIINKYYDHKKDEIINSAEKRAFLRRSVINEIEKIFKNGYEVAKEGIILSSTAIINLIENYNENGELISINKIKDKRKAIEKSLLINFDINYDFRKDANGLNVNTGSETLKKYHQLLWRKMLKNNKYFNIHGLVENVYLFCFINSKEEYQLSSFSIFQTYLECKNMQSIINNICKEEMNIFLNLCNTISSFIVFPSNQIDNLPNINQECNTNIQICNRFDIILECIKRYYENKKSPLMKTLKRYNKYFKLFTDFKGYCEFFFLEDLTMENYTKIKFYLPFENFMDYPYPKTIEEYNQYKNNVINIYKKRSNRILKYYKSLK